MNPYVTDRDMIERILAAARRGANVRLVVSDKSNNDQATAALEHHYRDLIEAGGEVWELSRTRPIIAGCRNRRRASNFAAKRCSPTGSCKSFSRHD